MVRTNSLVTAVLLDLRFGGSGKLQQESGDKSNQWEIALSLSSKLKQDWIRGEKRGENPPTQATSNSHPFLSLPKPSLIVRTESNVRKEIRKKPDPPCVDCNGTGSVQCGRCCGKGRRNHVHLEMLPKGEWPKWCKTCGGSGLTYCASCLGSGKYRDIFGFPFVRQDANRTQLEQENSTPNIHGPHVVTDQLLNVQIDENAIRETKPGQLVALTSSPSLGVKLKRRTSRVLCALPETAASIALAAMVVGAAATVLLRQSTGSKENEVLLRTCEDCGGSGLCSECKGEGFVLKKLSEESAERARLNAKNMATRYTAALPKKWSYCNKCSSARTCRTCGGSGKLSY